MALYRSTTDRGFPTVEFIDHYNQICIVQISSLAEERCIWLGLNEIDPKIMAKDASRLGIETSEKVGLIDYHIPEEVSLPTRMHLTQEQVIELLPVLQKFAETGEIN
jgi:hypothetical protein